MAMIDIKKDPSPRDIAVFGILFVLFCGLVGAIVLGKPRLMLVLTVATAVGWLFSVVFNREEPIKLQLLGLLPPAVFLLIYEAHALSPQPLAVAAVIWAIGVVGGVAVWASAAVGKQAYLGWMYAFMPMGWTVSQVVLGIVYYLVVTPIGLIMRGLGRDPMHRRFDPTADSYWTRREPVDGTSRYFRQF